jgi:hypothetical protein
VSIRVIQWGAGRNGAALIRAIAQHRDLELVGCRVWSDAKAGLDAGELAGIEPLGVIATNDRTALLALDADVAIVCPQNRPDPSENERDLTDLLRSGKNVISVSGAYSLPTILPDGRGDAIIAACREGGTTLAAAGINPGFIAERLAPTLTGMCADVESVLIEETYDCSRATANIVFDTIAFARPLDEWDRNSPIGQMFNEMFVQLIHNVAHSLGVELREVEWTARVAPAHRDIDIAAGRVRQGTVGAVEQVWTGIPVDPSQIRITKRTCWVVADDIPGFTVKSGWQIHVRGLPNVTAEIRLDGQSEVEHQGEAMVGGAIGVIPEVIAAPPGFLHPTVYAPFRKHFANA